VAAGGGRRAPPIAAGLVRQSRHVRNVGASQVSSPETPAAGGYSTQATA
jgi:hypothetical protein